MNVVMLAPDSCRPCAASSLHFHPLRTGNLDPETGQAHIGHLPRHAQKSDRADTQILENLCTEADLAPLPAACFAGGGLLRFRDRDYVNTGSAIAQHDQDTAAFGLETLQ